MKKLSLLLVLTCISLSSYGQLASVVTDKAHEALGNYKTFILVDMATQLVLAKEPVKYNPESEMPQCYFSTVLAAEIGVSYATNRRLMAINTLPVVEGQHWVLCDNYESEATIFSRRKFLADFRAQYLWIPVIYGDYVMFLNLKNEHNTYNDGFLSIHEDGTYSSISDPEDASKWKLILVQ